MRLVPEVWPISLAMSLGSAVDRSFLLVTLVPGLLLLPSTELDVTSKEFLSWFLALMNAAKFV